MNVRVYTGACLGKERHSLLLQSACSIIPHTEWQVTLLTADSGVLLVDRLLCTNWQKFCHWNLNTRGPVWNHHQLWENLENLPADSSPTLYSKSLLSDSLETFSFSSEIKFSWNWKHETSRSPIPGASALQEWEHDVYAAWSERENDPKTRH